MNSDIELVSKALADFNAVEAGLQLLREQYANVVFDVTTTKGMDAAKAARLALREPRYEVERIRKAAKAPILALGRKLDDDAKRITAEIAKLEDPIDQQIKNEEERKERERQARIAAEEARVKAIQDRITDIRGVVSVPFSDAGNVADHIRDIEAIVIDDSFQEFRQTAEDAKLASLARLREIQAGFEEREREAKRIAAEREELARLRAEQEARDAAERARIAEEQRAAREAQEAEAARAAEELRQRREALAQQEREQQARIREEQERLAREREELARQQEEARRAQEAKKPTKKPGRPTDDEIIGVLVAHYGVSEKVVIGWLSEMKVAA